jgi:hypothetical protein
MFSRSLLADSLLGDSCPWKKIPIVPALPASTSSMESICQLQAWLKNCSQHHGCTPCLEPVSLPTRVLDVGTDGSTPKLVVTLDGQAGSYICLSHCWGSSQPLTTTTMTLSERRHGIEWQKLPKTFQDAITVSRQLEIRFLWIDSLCILQDDTDDWQKESAKMATIYQNASLTLAASKSKDALGGLFSQPVYTDQKLVGYNNLGEEYCVYARREGVHHITSSICPDNCEPRWTYFPLLKRAWAYQERLLSPRVVHFGSQELIWECPEMTACQCSEPKPYYVSERPGNILFSQASNDMLYAHWRSIVSHYSTLNITALSDRLPALSGLAKKMQSKVHDQYLAGMWRNSLTADLFWKAVNGDSTPKLPLWRAPSWSWASVDTEISFDFGRQPQAYCQVVDAKCVPDGVDTTGGVLSGYIVIRAPKIRGQLKLATLFLNTLVEFSPGCQAWVSLDYQEARLISDVYCIKAGPEQGLVLHCVDEKKQTYERIGILIGCEGLSRGTRSPDLFEDVEDSFVTII